MVYNFIRGGAGINVLARHVGARVVVVDMGVAAGVEHQELMNKKVDYGTNNITRGPAMSREQAVRSIEAEIEVFEEELRKGMDVVGTGDMGIGNTTPSSAIIAAITGEKVEKVTGRGTGIDDFTLETKIRAIKKALEINSPDKNDPLDVLGKSWGL